MIYDEDRAIFFEITNICNHRCIHCCKQWEDNRVNRIASFKTLDKIISLPKKSLTISGGEPSLVRDKVYYLINNESKNITINTNLTGWSKQDIAFINNNDKTNFNVSVVSLKRDIYEEITKSITYDIFIKNLNLLNNKHYITIVVNNINLDSVDFTIKILLLMGFKNILVTPQVPTPNLSVDVNLVINMVKNLHNKYNNIANIVTQGFCNLDFCDHKCEAGIGRFLIDTKGDVYPCAPIHRECKLGTIDTDIDILKRNGTNFFLSYNDQQKFLCKGFMF